MEGNSDFQTRSPKKPPNSSPSTSTLNSGLMSPPLMIDGHVRKSSKDMIQSTGSIDDTDRLDRSDRSLYNITGTSSIQTRNKQPKGIKSSIDKGKQESAPITMKYKMYKPRDPDQCPLFCSFYAEFDNKVGPKICYQSPKHFMEQDISISINKIHEILSKSFSKSKQDKDTNADIPPTLPSNSQSIFDATCEYIISELTGQLISISTHNLHIIAKPIIIQDARYERNSFLFSVGFVIRRQIDPAPFRPLLTTLASTLRSMELESQFLSNPTTKPVLQSLLDVLVPSLNSPSSKCHILLDKTNSLHLQHFPAPKAHASTIKDYVVPVLLRPESQLYSLGWDLTINWIVPHINGIKYAKYIAKSSQVDEEMVRACLRVLRHHNVLACVDIFRYSNIYESTPKAQLALSGKLKNLMEGAYQFIVKMPQKQTSSPSPTSMMLIPPQGTEGPQSYPPFQSLDANENPPTSYASLTSTKSRRNNLTPNSSKDSFMSPVSPQLNQKMSTSIQSQTIMPTQAKQDKESILIAISILYTSCNRGQTLADIIMKKLKTSSQSEHDKTSKKRSKITTSSLGSHESLDSNTSVAQKIDWKETFSMLDFRRFITFGVIHGLIHRVHEFPFAIDNGAQLCDIESDDYPSLMTESDDLKNQKHIPSHSSVRSDSTLKSSHGMLTLAKKIALAMDGTRCDDELACMFEREMKELKQIVKKYANKDIMSVYSTVDN
jgi:nitrogen permease regulator 2-like protein